MTLHNSKQAHSLRALSYRAIVPLLMLVLVACGSSEPTMPAAAPAEATAIPTVAPVVAATIAPTPEPPTAEPATPVTASEPTAAPVAETTQLSFLPATYTNESAGFALDYPSDWTIDPNSQIGVRGGQALLLSPGTTIDTLADGGTRVSIATYDWDPNNDLNAWLAQRKIAWDSSGFAITREEEVQLAGGRTAYLLVINSPDTPVFTLLTTIGEDYLQIAGDGDQALIEEIARTLRPLN